ncbi:carbohydrate kinase family protein [Streptomyces triticirhizae]|uniref:Carbohydrate kinase family protein n=1 Tax=Streptomyces triticirhizae TaxID=2483353 RepID=A0A3M2L9Z2_9ACTN|nr:carbohydrate kinase family protein [Streptomyces triticirhizae]RMI33866.1 carbohydrate kinase family protein [Streptomyces triticirhizae]
MPEHTGRANGVLVVGTSGVDTIVRVERLAVPEGDLAHVEPIRDYVAHSGTGWALGFHALGRPTSYLTYLGDDAQGRLVGERFRAAGLRFEALPAPHGTSRSVNLVDAEGRRFSFYDGRLPWELRLPADVVLPHLERAAHVHVGPAGFTRDLLGELADRPVTTSTDVHAWDGRDAAMAPWALGVDYFFMSAAHLGDRVAEVLESVVERGRARVAVATDGARGCHVLARPEAGGDGRVRHFPAVTPPRAVVDSNGAGDAFATAFLHAHLDGAPLERCVLAGAVSGAFAATHHGTHERHISVAELAAATAEITGEGGVTRPGPAGWRWS